MEEARKTPSPAVIRLSRRRQQLKETIDALCLVLREVEIDLQAERIQDRADSYGGAPHRRKEDVDVPEEWCYILTERSSLANEARLP